VLQALQYIVRCCELKSQYLPLQVRRHKRKQSELHGKYLKSEVPNPEFEHEEGHSGRGGGSGGAENGGALARGDDYERLALQKDRAAAAGAGPVTPRSAKVVTPRAGGAGATAAAAAGGAAAGGALGGLLGRRKVHEAIHSRYLTRPLLHPNHPHLGFRVATHGAPGSS
jgi:hypothetical protein